jgi:uncharacterized membrane protein HdeD (DUF308 family)
MKLLRGLVQGLGIIGIIVGIIVFGAVGSCLVASDNPNGIPGVGPHATAAPMVGGIIGLVVGVVLALRQFRRR